MKRLFSRQTTLLLLSGLFAHLLTAQTTSSPNNSSGYSRPQATGSQNTSGNNSSNNLPPAERLLATDPSYKLSIGDEVDISIHNEPDISTAERIDQKGFVRMPYIDKVSLAKMIVREAEQSLETILIEKEILKTPLVKITVREYALREVSVLGAVNSPGKFSLPRESDSIEIFDLFSRIGGFRPTARSGEVKVSRLDENGKEQVFIINVERMITGRGATRGTQESFLIFPGDRIFVPERVW